MFSACTARPTSVGPQVVSLAQASKTVLSTSIPQTRSSPTDAQQPTTVILPSTPTPTPRVSELCSPLDGISLGELTEIVVNPFKAPGPGQDNGHHGVDFSFWRHGDRVGMTGLPVLSMLDGRVAASLPDRPPYGNLVIVETPYNQVSPALFQRLLSFLQDEPPEPDSRLTCPTPWVQPLKDASQASLYLLYAHLDQPSEVQIGDTLMCGQSIGVVGNTGTSTNAHLHLEVRFGPPGENFTSMSHYNTQASPEEIRNYCTWRISGRFRMINPMDLIATP